LNSRDRESGILYQDLVNSEEFLASHVLQITGGIPPGSTGPTKDSRIKARQYTTINARTVIIKDGQVYSNKGFKTLNQSQILYDGIFYQEGTNNQQWSVYYISQPLIGVVETLVIHPAVVGSNVGLQVVSQSSAVQTGLKKGEKDIKDFEQLLREFSFIGRTIQPGLDRLFEEITQQSDHPTAKKTSRTASISSQTSKSSLAESLAALRSSIDAGNLKSPIVRTHIDPNEEELRNEVEKVVFAAIELYHTLDGQQLTKIEIATNLTELEFEKLIERYVLEHLHSKFLFARLRQINHDDDSKLEKKVKRMINIDIAQVGIPIEDGRVGKRKLASRIDEAVTVFKRLSTAESPQQMTEILLSTQQVIAAGNFNKSDDIHEVEKQSLVMTINADILVSMLLVVIIRSGVKNLYARLTYMRRFNFFEEVDIGETGYAISTFEAVLAYLTAESDPIRRASRQNLQLWSAVRNGDVDKVCNMLLHQPITSLGEDSASFMLDTSTIGSSDSDIASIINDRTNDMITADYNVGFAAVGGSLNHVFPFSKPPTPPPDVERPVRKRVSMAASRANSVSSIGSSANHSRSGSVNSIVSATYAADLSVESLVQTQNIQGDSLLMMAIDAGHYNVLQELLRMKQHFPKEFILEDCNTSGITLLSAAVQNGNRKIVEVILHHVMLLIDNKDEMKRYLQKTDDQGRCVGHYVFHHPWLLDQIGADIPWHLKDKNDQTPLFAICRSYDHGEYGSMVRLGLNLAKLAQSDPNRLHLDDHVDRKGNTLLHIINDYNITRELLKDAYVDVNAGNERKFTPFMVASKYGKLDLVNILLSDARTEVQMRDARGLTAIDLAKDDDIRNTIDDLILLSKPTGNQIQGRTTMIVRSFFGEDLTSRLLLKSVDIGQNGEAMVTTCRRNFADFRNLAAWLSLEHPASWLPDVFDVTSPFLLPSRPSRQGLHDIQLRLDQFLQNLLTHSTFANHELLWEFFLVPDIDIDMLAERSKRKAEIRVENLKDEFDPIIDTTEVQVFISTANEQMEKLFTLTGTVIRCINKQRQIRNDLSDLSHLASSTLSTFSFLPEGHKKAFERYCKSLLVYESNPSRTLYYSFDSIYSSSKALLKALDRPMKLISAMTSARKSLDRGLGSLNRQSRWTPNIGLFDETHKAIAEQARERAKQTEKELSGLGSELRYTHQTIVSELAGWQDNHVKFGKRMLRDYVQGQIVKEKDRLEKMKRAMREIATLNS